MDVAAQEQTVRHLVRTLLPVRLDVGRLENGERVLVGDGARLAVRIAYRDPEWALAEAGLDQLRFAVSRRFVVAGRGPAQTFGKPARPLACLSDASALADGQIVGLPLDDALLPIMRLGYPLLGREEHRGRDHQASDFVIATNTDGARGPVALDSSPHCLDVGRPVFDPECGPRERATNSLNVSGEETESSDCIPRTLQAEEERLARFDRTEGLVAARWLPEVHLVDGALPCQELVPVEIGIGDPAVHASLE